MKWIAYGKILRSTISKEKSEFSVAIEGFLKFMQNIFKENKKLMTILQEKVVINIFL